MRTIIEDSLYQAQVKALGLTAQRLDELLFYVSYALAKKPDLFWEADSTRGIWLVRGIADVPYVIWYKFDEQTVTLLAIEKVSG